MADTPAGMVDPRTTWKKLEEEIEWRVWSQARQVENSNEKGGEGESEY